jgi:hypothetical protein
LTLTPLKLELITRAIDARGASDSAPRYHRFTGSFGSGFLNANAF